MATLKKYLTRLFSKITLLAVTALAINHSTVKASTFYIIANVMGKEEVRLNINKTASFQDLTTKIWEETKKASQAKSWTYHLLKDGDNKTMYTGIPGDLQSTFTSGSVPKLALKHLITFAINDPDDNSKQVEFSGYHDEKLIDILFPSKTCKLLKNNKNYQQLTKNEIEIFDRNTKINKREILANISMQGYPLDIKPKEGLWIGITQEYFHTTDQKTQAVNLGNPALQKLTLNSSSTVKQTIETLLKTLPAEAETKKAEDYILVTDRDEKGLAATTSLYSIQEAKRRKLFLIPKKYRVPFSIEGLPGKKYALVDGHEVTYQKIKEAISQKLIQDAGTDHSKMFDPQDIQFITNIMGMNYNIGVDKKEKRSHLQNTTSNLKIKTIRAKIIVEYGEFAQIVQIKKLTKDSTLAELAACIKDKTIGKHNAKTDFSYSKYLVNGKKIANGDAARANTTLIENFTGAFHGNKLQLSLVEEAKAFVLIIKNPAGGAIAIKKGDDLTKGEYIEKTIHRGDSIVSLFGLKYIIFNNFKNKTNGDILGITSIDDFIVKDSSGKIIIDTLPATDPHKYIEFTNINANTTLTIELNKKETINLKTFDGDHDTTGTYQGLNIEVTRGQKVSYFFNKALEDLKKEPYYQTHGAPILQDLIIRSENKELTYDDIKDQYIQQAYTLITSDLTLELKKKIDASYQIEGVPTSKKTLENLKALTKGKAIIDTITAAFPNVDTNTITEHYTEAGTQKKQAIKDNTTIHARKAPLTFTFYLKATGVKIMMENNTPLPLKPAHAVKVNSQTKISTVLTDIQNAAANNDDLKNKHIIINGIKINIDPLKNKTIADVAYQGQVDTIFVTKTYKKDQEDYKIKGISLNIGPDKLANFDNTKIYKATTIGEIKTAADAAFKKQDTLKMYTQEHIDLQIAGKTLDNDTYIGAKATDNAQLNILFKETKVIFKIQTDKEELPEEVKTTFDQTPANIFKNVKDALKPFKAKYDFYQGTTKIDANKPIALCKQENGTYTLSLQYNEEIKIAVKIKGDNATPKEVTFKNSDNTYKTLVKAIQDKIKTLQGKKLKLTLSDTNTEISNTQKYFSPDFGPLKAYNALGAGKKYITVESLGDAPDPFKFTIKIDNKDTEFIIEDNETPTLGYLQTFLKTQTGKFTGKLNTKKDDLDYDKWSLQVDKKDIFPKDFDTNKKLADLLKGNKIITLIAKTNKPDNNSNQQNNQKNEDQNTSDPPAEDEEMSTTKKLIIGLLVVSAFSAVLTGIIKTIQLKKSQATKTPPRKPSQEITPFTQEDPITREKPQEGMVTV